MPSVLGRPKYIPEGFEKKMKKKLTNRYDTQSAQSNAGKQSYGIGQR